MPVHIQKLIDIADQLVTEASAAGQRGNAADEDRLLKQAEVMALVAIAQALQNQGKD